MATIRWRSSPSSRPRAPSARGASSPWFGEFCGAFNDADVVIVADVYPAGEAPLEGFDRDGLVEGLRRWGHRRVLPLGAVADLPAMVAEETKDGDLVLFLGAGDITGWAYALPGQLEAMAPNA
jgi:UDP-N-acetylmuramate--alanine ligase